MADTTFNVVDSKGNNARLKLKDNGDGIFSMGVDAVLDASGITIGKVDQGAAGTVPWLASDAGPAWNSSRGVTGTPFNSSNATGTLSVTDAPTSGQKLVITDLIISVDTDMNVSFKEEVSGTIVAGPYYLSARSVNQLTPRGKFKLSVADRKLQVSTSVVGNITVSSYYYSEV